MKFGNAKMRKKKDLLFYCILALMLFKQDTLEVEENSIVEICSTSILPYGTYRNGNIYICKLGEEDYYLENTSGNDIVCVDGRELSDANMKIMSSYKITNREDMEEILRVLKKVNLYIFCNGEQIPFYIRFFVLERKCKMDIIIWNKTNALPLFNNKYLSDKEYCLYFRKGGYCSPKSYEDAKTIFLYSINIKDKKKCKHPTIKPESLIRKLIRNSLMKMILF